jgi:GDP-L-fucose synthase
MMDLNSKIYVAGHTGLIGSGLLRRFARDGYKNIIVRSHHELDLTNQADVDAFFKHAKPEYVVLAAGKVGGIVENKTYPADFIRINLAIQANVLSAAHETGVKRVINFGSSCMYPRECPQPMQESALFSGVPEPTSMAYAASKMAGMQMCLAYNQQYGEKRFIPVIPNSAFGPNDNFNPESGHVLSALIRRFHEAKAGNFPSVTLWGTGSPCREFIHSDDIADACLMLLKSDLTDLEFPINLGSGRDISIKDLAQVIANVVGYEGELNWDTTKPDGSPRKLLDSKRINRFGWSPSVSFESGLRATYEWYLNNVAKQEAE